MRGLRARWRHERWRRQQHRRHQRPTALQRLTSPAAFVARVVVGWPGAWVIGAAVAGLVWLAGTGAPAAPTLGPLAPPPAPIHYLAIGGAETVTTGGPTDLRDTYPQVLFRTLPTRTVLVVVAEDDLTVARAVDEVQSQAGALAPTVATVLLGRADAAAGTDPARFGDDLGRLATALRAAGAQTIVVATEPLLPGVDATALRALVDATRSAATRFGLVLVDTTGLDLSAGSSLVDPGGDLTVAGHFAVARLLGDALGPVANGGG